MSIPHGFVMEARRVAVDLPEPSWDEWEESWLNDFARVDVPMRRTWASIDLGAGLRHP